MFEKWWGQSEEQEATGADAVVETQHPTEDEALKQQVIEVLRTIYDPEIPVNIYDLGLIYEIHATEYGSVYIKMTLTTAGCPVAQSFPGVVQAHVMTVAGVAEANVEIVWDPPWSRERMSEAAKLQLGLY
jgi:FeS assembly SUF system protein